MPEPVSTPGPIRVNEALARHLGVDPVWLGSPDGIEVIAGNRIPIGAEPIATVYAGHQFGGWNPRLGDGRALLGPVLREYIVSEAMATLGIPTTRSLRSRLGNRCIEKLHYPGPFWHAWRRATYVSVRCNTLRHARRRTHCGCWWNMSWSVISPIQAKPKPGPNVA